MPRFAAMIRDGMHARGHEVEEWSVPVVFGDRVAGGAAKWLGYVDQFVLFPREVRRRLRNEPKDTLFVVTDQALGMWVPLVRERPHVIHCHDFLAQRSALGEFPENPTGWTGRQYQALIRRGYRMGRTFVSVSEKTREDLHRFLGRIPSRSVTVYNPLNNPFFPLPHEVALSRLAEWRSELAGGYLVHVGGDQWYKNRPGVVAIYRAYCERVIAPVPLVMIGKFPSTALREEAADCANGGCVWFLSGLDDAQVHAAYAAATALLFPSLEEGFGWPIAEAQACGCPVITTAAAPMNEVGGRAATYIPRAPRQGSDAYSRWAEECAIIVEKIINLSSQERNANVRAGLENVIRFDRNAALDRYEAIYQVALEPMSQKTR